MSFEKPITMMDGFLETKETPLGGGQGKSYIRFSQKVFGQREDKDSWRFVSTRPIWKWKDRDRDGLNAQHTSE